MKNISILLIILLATACGKKDITEIQHKQEQLTQKEKDLVTLKKEILDLKREIQSLDTNARDNAIAIMATEIKKGVFKNPFEVQGIVKSDRNVLVSPEVPAKIVRLHIKEGQKVSKGQVIATLDGSTANAQINELEGSMELAKLNFEKQERLWNKNIGSEMQYLQAKNQYEQLQNAIRTAQTQLGKYSLRSPISGTVDEVMANEGEFVGSMTGGPVARIVNLSDIKIVASASETYLGKLKVGQEVSLFFPSIQLKTTEKVSAISNVINLNNRTFSFYVKPTKYIKMMKPNLLAMITAHDYEANDAISVPTKLIRVANGQHFIYTIKTNGNKRIVQKSIIQIDKQFPNKTIIKSGLIPGDMLITEGVNSVIVGDEVKIITE
ncbi:MAG: efflux RND transporter periplasmic adaptor subunit [Bacteroidia bacterium]|nr:efflux RND transporter periplasmic adaptor subunit [Bacteroidia bacterium]|tara:strand:+ start:4138 stop:5277 length:1140 start_codon:yes stop_codon:yes gene_type:complete